MGFGAVMPPPTSQDRLSAWAALGFVALTFLCELGQSMVAPNYWRADFALIFTFLFGWRKDRGRAMVTGCLCGLAQDAATGNLIGLGGLTKSVLGYTVAVISPYFSSRPLGLVGLLNGVFAVMDDGLGFIVLASVGRRAVLPVGGKWLSVALLTGVVAELAAWILERICNRRPDFAGRD